MGGRRTSGSLISSGYIHELGALGGGTADVWVSYGPPDSAGYIKVLNIAVKFDDDSSQQGEIAYAGKTSQIRFTGVFRDSTYTLRLTQHGDSLDGKFLLDPKHGYSVSGTVVDGFARLNLINDETNATDDHAQLEWLPSRGDIAAFPSGGKVIPNEVKMLYQGRELTLVLKHGTDSIDGD